MRVLLSFQFTFLSRSRTIAVVEHMSLLNSFRPLPREILIYRRR